jgi:ABC-type transport system involved in multi-copper enzyme maturation permease subunit
MSWLLWREYRLNRVILAAGAVGLLTPYVIALLVVGIASMIGEPPRNAFKIACIWSIVLSLATVAMLAGNAIAGERADRSAEFIAYLPLQRRRTLASKWLLFLITLAVVIGFNTLLAMIMYGPPKVARHVEPLQAFHWLSWFMAIYSFCWFFSSLSSSPVLACSLGITTYFLLYGVVLTVVLSVADGRLEGIPEYVPGLAKDFEHQMNAGHAVIVVPAAIACYCIGIWLYLRRPET